MEMLMVIESWHWDVMEDNWDDNYKLLLQYHTDNEHCNLPCKRYKKGVGNSPDHQLYQWLCKQKMLKKHKSVHLTERWIALLEKLGIIWEKDWWAVRYTELLTFCQKNNHWDVKSEANPKLKEWLD